MDPELQKEIEEKLKELENLSKELNSLRDKVALKYAVDLAKKDVVGGPYRTPGSADKSPSPENKKYTVRDLLDRIKFNEELLDGEVMSKKIQAAREHALKADPVKALRIYDELLEYFDKYPPCTIKGNAHMDAYWFRRGKKND